LNLKQMAQDFEVDERLAALLANVNAVRAIASTCKNSCFKVSYGDYLCDFEDRYNNQKKDERKTNSK